MAATFDEDDTLESQALATTLDPYGQLIKMLLPRALCLALYDADGVPLWLSDVCGSSDLQQLVEECLSGAGGPAGSKDERDGFARSWHGDTSYVFLLRDGPRLLGAVAVMCRDGSHGSRPLSFLLGLLRPALQVLSRELTNRCNIDPTTGLLTKPALEQRASAWLTDAGMMSEHCVAYGDLDRLHIVNENQGMLVGDMVIERVAATMRAHLDADVLAARISGARFALFFPDTSLQRAQQSAQALCRAIEAIAFEHEGVAIQLSMSIGIAEVSKTALSLSHAFATAEMACKAAKSRGRNRVEVNQEPGRSIVRHHEAGGVNRVAP